MNLIYCLCDPDSLIGRAIERGDIWTGTPSKGVIGETINSTILEAHAGIGPGQLLVAGNMLPNGKAELHTPVATCTGQMIEGRVTAETIDQAIDLFEVIDE